MNDLTFSERLYHILDDLKMLVYNVILVDSSWAENHLIEAYQQLRIYAMTLKDHDNIVLPNIETIPKDFWVDKDIQLYNQQEKEGIPEHKRVVLNSTQKAIIEIDKQLDMAMDKRFPAEAHPRIIGPGMEILMSIWHSNNQLT